MAQQETVDAEFVWLPRQPTLIPHWSECNWRMSRSWTPFEWTADAQDQLSSSDGLSAHWSIPWPFECWWPLSQLCLSSMSMRRSIRATFWFESLFLFASLTADAQLNKGSCEQWDEWKPNTGPLNCEWALGGCCLMSYASAKSASS